MGGDCVHVYMGSRGCFVYSEYRLAHGFSLAEFGVGWGGDWVLAVDGKMD